MVVHRTGVAEMTHQNLRVPPCPQRASGHAWRLARERSTRECEAEACQACGLVRMTSYRTGQLVRYETAEPMHAGEERAAGGGELPSVTLTTRFLTLCQHYGSEALAVHIVAAGHSTGVPNLPPGDDWTAWDADQMRAAVEHLERKRSGR